MNGLNLTQNKKILIVSPFPPPFGGIARYSEDLMKSALNEEFTLIKYNTAQFDDLRNLSKVDLRGYTRIFNVAEWKFLFYVLKSFYSFFSLLIDESPEVVHIHTSSFWGFWRSAIYMVLAKLVGISVVFHLHNAIDQFYFIDTHSSFGRWLIRCVLNIADTNIVLSDGIKNIVTPLTYSEVVSVYNGIQTSLFDRQKSSETNRHIIFLSAASIGQEKGSFDTIQAIPKVWDQYKNIRFVFVGRGEIQAAKNLCARLGIEDCVEFTGMVPEEEKNAHFRSAHVFLLPSYAEGQPISILEAMASGLPVITSDVGSIAEVIHDGINGLIVKPGDIEKLASAIRKLASDIELRRKMGQINYKIAREKFDVKRVFNDVGNVYRRFIRQEIKKRNL